MGRGAASEVSGGAVLLYGSTSRRCDPAFAIVSELICRRVSSGATSFSDLSLLDAEEARAPTREEHRRRIGRNREALRGMYARGLLERVEGPNYECFRLSEVGVEQLMPGGD